MISVEEHYKQKPETIWEYLFSLLCKHYIAIF